MALKLAMEGSNESARVQASRVLMDALHEPERAEAQDDAAMTSAARANVDKLLLHAVEGCFRPCS